MSFGHRVICAKQIAPIAIGGGVLYGATKFKKNKK